VVPSTADGAEARLSPGVSAPKFATAFVTNVNDFNFDCEMLHTAMAVLGAIMAENRTQ
jgi:hypothetical protein